MPRIEWHVLWRRSREPVMLDSQLVLLTNHCNGRHYGALLVKLAARSLIITVHIQVGLAKLWGVDRVTHLPVRCLEGLQLPGYA